MTGSRDQSHLNDLSRAGARAGITTEATVWTLFGQRVPGMKAGQWVDTLVISDWRHVLTYIQAWISLLLLLEPKAEPKEEDSQAGQMLQRGLLKGYKGSLCQLV